MTLADTKARGAGRPDNAIQMVPKLSIDQRRFMLACILADEMLFSAAKSRLLPELLASPDEAALLAVWVAARQLSDAHGNRILFHNRPQAWQMLSVEVRSIFQSRPDLFPLTAWDEAIGETGFVDWFYQCGADEFNIAYGKQLLSNFLKERITGVELQRLAQATQLGVVSNTAQLAQAIADKDRELGSIGEDPVKSGAPAGWSPPVIIRKSTSISWLDAFLNGGHRAGETYLVTGATGAGKTTLALQLAQGVAANERALSELSLDSSMDPSAKQSLLNIGWTPGAAYEMRHVYYFHYEMSEDDIRNKLWSSAAMIDLNRIEKMGVPGYGLSTSTNLSQEEVAILKSVISQNKNTDIRFEDFPGESERLAIATAKLSQNFWQVDCSSSTTVGRGYIPEIAAIMSGEVKKGRKPAVIVIDYASACVDRATTDPKQNFELLRQFGRFAEQDIAVPYQTPVWILQQLSGASNRKTAATKQHHADAAGCASMANACWFAFNLGTTDEKTGCRHFTCSKARRAQLGLPPVLKIAGGFNRLVDVSSQFQFNRGGKVESAKRGSGSIHDPTAGRSEPFTVPGETENTKEF